MSNSKTLEMEEQAACPVLLDDLVAKIITMMPCPDIFKARMLSKIWQTRFSCLAPDDEEADRGLVPAFQKEVTERFRTWGAKWSVFICDGQLYGYSRDSGIWQRMPCLSFLPRQLLVSSRHSIGPPLPSYSADSVISSRLQIEGPLILICHNLDETRYVYGARLLMYVANIFTRSWKPLRQSHLLTCKLIYQKLVIDESSKSYTVILVDCQDRFSPALTSICVDIYNSVSDTWRRKFLRLQCIFDPTTAVHSNGVLYILSRQNPWELFAYSLEEQTLKRLRLQYDFMLLHANHGFLITDMTIMADKADFFMIVTIMPSDALEMHQIVLLTIDFSTQISMLLAYTERLQLRSGRTNACAIGGGCISIEIEEQEGTRILQYSLESKTWRDLQAPMNYDLLGTCVSPRLNPFMAV